MAPCRPTLTWKQAWTGGNPNQKHLALQPPKPDQSDLFTQGWNFLLSGGPCLWVPRRQHPSESLSLLRVELVGHGWARSSVLRASLLHILTLSCLKPELRWGKGTLLDNRARRPTEGNLQLSRSPSTSCCSKGKSLLGEKRVKRTRKVCFIGNLRCKVFYF